MTSDETFSDDQSDAADATATASTTRSLDEFAHAGAPVLIAVWLEALSQFADLAEQLDDDAWRTQSRCPGWTAGDIVAHVLSLESELHGDAVPDHEPDWSALPHVSDDFGRYTEVPVDWYRSKDRDVVVAELREIIAWRGQDLADEPTDLNAPMTGPLGFPVPRGRMILTRILDTWVHEQDVRAAAQLPGGLDTDAAIITAEQFSAALPFVWGKRVGAPIGATVRVVVTGPGVTFDRTVVVGDDGRATVVSDASDNAAPTVGVVLDFPLYVALSAGRAGAVDLARESAAITGDPELAARFLAALATTP